MTNRGIIGLDLGDAHPAAGRLGAPATTRPAHDGGAHDGGAHDGGDAARAWGAAAVVREVLDAESAGFHLATLPDAARAPLGAPRPDAVQRAALAAPHTRTIALVPEVDAVASEPFHVATQLASLDYISYGRAGWLVAADGSARRLAALGRGPLGAEDALDEASDAVEAARRLWDTWEDTAEIRDVATGRYLDADRVHYADFRGRSFSVKGPSIIPRPPQGQLPVLAPYGLVPAGQADVLLVSAPAGDLLVAEAAAAREAYPEHIVLAELDVVLDARGRSGADRLAELDALAAWESPHALFAGGTRELADYLGELLAVAHGVRLHPAVLAVELPELAQLVLPELRRRGRLVPVNADAPFRHVLGLRRPQSRYTTTRAGGPR